jgi:glycosyltransferase involved in cell wall biosynthesis
MRSANPTSPVPGISRPRKVVIIHNVPNPIRTPLFARVSDDPGIDLEVWFLAGSMPGRSWDESVNERFRWRILPGRHIGFQREDLITLYYNPSMFRELSHHRPDVLIIGGWDSPSCWMAAAWARFKDVPYIVWSGSLPGQVAHGGTSSRAERARRQFGRSVARRLVKGAAGGLAYGSLSSSYLSDLGLKETRIWKAWNAVDEKQLSAQAQRLRSQRDDLRAGFGIPIEACVALFVGRLQPFKRAGDLVSAASRIGHPSRPLVLLIVGDGPQRGELERSAKLLGVDAVFAGELSYRSVLPAYAAADFLVLPSGDIWGLVVNEALASGLPVIAASSVGSAADLLAPSGAGIVFPTGDVAALTGAMQRLLGDPKVLEDMSKLAPSALDGKGLEAASDAFIDAIRNVQGGS